MRALFLLLGLFLLFPFIASAQSEEDLKKAELLFQDAQRLYNVRDYEAALQKYKEAYLLSAAPELLFNMGQCYRLLGKDNDARETYKIFLRELPDSPQREQVERLIRDLDAKISAASTPASVPASGPEETPTEAPKPLSPRPFFVGSAGSLALSGVFGVAFLSSRRVTSQLANADDSALLQEEINAQLRRTKIAGISANALAGISIAGAGIGLFLSHQQKKEPSALTLSIGPQQLTLSKSF